MMLNELVDLINQDEQRPEREEVIVHVHNNLSTDGCSPAYAVLSSAIIAVAALRLDTADPEHKEIEDTWTKLQQ